MGRQKWRVSALTLFWLVRSTIAAAGTDGLVLHAHGIYSGRGDISDGQIKCEIPSTGTALPDASFAMGIWNTYGSPTLFFPDDDNPHANPCGGWLQLQNNLGYMGLDIERVSVRFRIPGLRPTWARVPTRNAFPTACRKLRQHTLFASARLDPAGSLVSHSGSGAPNVAFLPLRPLVPPQIIQCLRAQYASLPIETFVSLQLVARLSVTATDDLGQRWRSNSVSYSLNLRHSCGNGRTDDGEQCDPAQSDRCAGVCRDNLCSNAANVACRTDADCTGPCLPAGDPNECTCALPPPP